MANDEAARDAHVGACDPLRELLRIMARLRDPVGGCAWDLEQTFATIAPYTLEEAYEVADAIERGSLPDLQEELGDLLLQVVFHAQMAREQGAFDFDDVARGIGDKLVRRHPNVFGDVRVADSVEQTRLWEEQKARDKAAAGKLRSVLDDVPVGLPALTRAVKLTKRAARANFDWPDAAGVWTKLDEELGELREAQRGGNADEVAAELGDVLFVLANLARKLGVDPEAALRGTNAKFERRFRHVEARAAATGATDLETLDGYWNEAKAQERTANGVTD
jgi:tetrapyrrole methylase family protein/MazG family protein/ATP diphosphatase